MKKELKFIHISKTAGSSIEHIGKNNNIKWGIFHKEYNHWHEPFSTKEKKLQYKYDWFLICRNPYKRIISEFYCRWGGIGKYENLIQNIEKEQFNNFIINIINHNVNNNYRRTISRKTISRKTMDKNKIIYQILNNRIKNKDMCISASLYHYIPQYLYISQYKDVKVHTLRFENLKKEFDDLMKEYNLDITLNLHKNKGKIKKFRVNDLSDEAISLINDVYHKDFEIFGYKKINNNIKMPINNHLKLIFVHIPRTSGTTFEEKVLDIHGNWPDPQEESLWGMGIPRHGKNKLTMQHMTYREICQLHGIDTGFKTVSIVRNPIHRVISLYYYWNEKKKWDTLNDFLKYVKVHIKNRRHWWSQYDYLCDENGNINIDHLLRFEELPENFNVLHSELDIPCYMDTEIMIDKEIRNLELLNDESLELIYEIYKKDFEIFNY